jgi:OOP family OmpA-OmpF porin
VFKPLALAAIVALLSSAASAADAPAFYAGADLGTGKDNGDYSNRATGYGVFGGYQINKNVALEAGLHRMVSAHHQFEDENGVHPFHYTFDQLAVSALASMDVRQDVSLFGRLGVARYFAHVSGAATESTQRDRTILGVGAAYRITPAVSVRIEAQRPYRNSLMWNAGVAMRF